LKAPGFFNPFGACEVKNRFSKFEIQILLVPLRPGVAPDQHRPDPAAVNRAGVAAPVLVVGPL
jgi:hypothetical protein